ncbi:MAG: deoxycytidine triphosphate deaminase [Candidatus Liptonbacteria bacterium]|nr:deoxycytidine triphosphate deaminase [Candidatus Liptonbacteria bacterium]
MLLSRDQILKHKKSGTIVIEPFNDRNLKTTSYDVTLGPWFWRERSPENRSSSVHNLYDADSTKAVWSGPFEAEPVGVIEKRLGREFKNIPRDATVVLLEPGETILGHTLEFIGGRDICVAKMYARSSMGRNFVEVCKDAGWGDVGYFNRWTMEITNNSRNYSIPLVVGRRIAQMVFYEVAPLDAAKIDYVGEGGKYQTSQNLDELKKSWNPHMMVPKMHMDWEVTKKEII